MVMKWSGTMKVQKRLGTYESRRSNVLERIVQNFHGLVYHFMQIFSSHVLGKVVTIHAITIAV